MKPEYTTPADPALPHQVVFLALKSEVHVSCNCLKVKIDDRWFRHDSMGVTKDLDDSRKIYNDPKNHRIEFTEGDAAKW